MKIVDIILLFFIYSFIGWILEVINSAIKSKKFVNRGFLIGPVCSIYGWGSITIVLLLMRYLKSPLILFIMAILICSVLEYSTSFVMEKMFKARWWDYSKKKFNLNGRICAETMIPFGFGSLIIMYLVNPFLMNILNNIPTNIKIVLATSFITIYIIDNIISFIIISGIKNTIVKTALDNTEEITKKVKDIILSQSYLTRRFVTAFPTLKAKMKKMSQAKQEKLKQKYNK